MSALVNNIEDEHTFNRRLLYTLEYYNPVPHMEK